MKDKIRSTWQINTKLNHPVDVPIHTGNHPLLQPIYNTAKFTPSKDFPYSDQFIYSRVSNPTVRQLELTLAEIQGKEDCLVLSSGIAALSNTFLGLLKAGDHMITFRELYKPGRVFIKEYLPRYNISSSVVSIKDLSQLEEAILPSTRLIHFESPTNPNLEIADIETIIKIARKNNILVSMDGTFGGLHQHREFDIDVMIQSLTKFANGHGDVISGAISGKKALIDAIRDVGLYLGANLDPQAAYLIERGLKTYMLRYEKQTSTAMKIAEYLEGHPAIKCVRYPGLTKHPEHELAKKQMKHMGAVVSFELKKEGGKTADEFCHKLELIQLAASLGSTESIICPSEIFFGLDLNPLEKQEMGISAYSLRLSVGLEEAEDLISDLKATLH